MRSSASGRALLALLAIYFFWGTTYLAIRMALESFPPLLLISGRFLASGSILLAVALLRGIRLPRGRELWLTSLYGVMQLGCGNGAVVFAETWIPSGIAALFITTAPFWMVGLQALLPGGERLHSPSLIGIFVGFLGALWLIAPAALASSSLGAGLVTGFLVIQAGQFFWCMGALLQRRLRTTAQPIWSGAVQQFAAGLAFLPPALLSNEHPVQWSARGVLAFGWLVIFGSIVGYTAFIYAMENMPVAVVSTHTYVNPLVAVALGWLFYREAFGARELSAMVAIFAGVALVKYYSGPSPAPKARAAKA